MSNAFIPVSIEQKLHQLRTFMEEHEYHERTISSYNTYVSKFLCSRYYDGGNPDLKSQIRAFLENEAVRAPNTFKYYRAAQYVFFKMETDTPYPLKNEQSSNQEIETLLSSFQEYLSDIRRLEELTISSELSHVRRFLEFAYGRYSAKPIVSNLDADDIRLFFVDEIPQLKPGSKGRIATSIRNFFRYQRFSGIAVNESVFRLPLSPAVWKLASIPTILRDDEFEALSTAFDLSTPTGRRNYAITLCFTELGLRCLEVANLSIDDFNWHEAIVSIKNTKTHADRKLPISTTVGKAVVDYLRFSRPETSSRTLFVRFSHTRGSAMGQSQIRNVIRQAYSKIGISKNITGTHILRRTVASRIYTKGNSLKMVADILGHESLDSTIVYTKLNMEQLSQASGIWPGGSSYE